jgi:threonine/homoserine/homoserine lactone efflux protein
MTDPAIASLVAFSGAAALLTVTPGLDTALVLRTSASEGRRRAAAAGAGILAGCLMWGVVVGLGLGALLAASQLAYTILKWAGAAYLVWLGLQLLLHPRRTFEDGEATGQAGAGAWFRRGLLSNALNPKIGVFYVSFLPQFIPANANVALWSFGLAGVHVLLSIGWFALLIGLGGRIGVLIRRRGVVTWLDRLTGGVFVAFGARLALEPSR